jgi:hypothetical protein
MKQGSGMGEVLVSGDGQEGRRDEQVLESEMAEDTIERSH